MTQEVNQYRSSTTPRTANQKSKKQMTTQQLTMLEMKVSPKKAAPEIEETLARDENTNEIYKPLSSTVDLKRKKRMLDFDKGLTLDALVDSEAYVSAIAESE